MLSDGHNKCFIHNSGCCYAHYLRSQIFKKCSEIGSSQRASLIAQLVKNPPAMQESPVQFLDQEDPLVKV